MPLFQKGARIGSSPDADRWVVTRKLGEGQFAEVYEVKDCFSHEEASRFAIKIEKRKDLKSVKQEYKIVKRLRETCAQVCTVVDAGTYEDRFYIVMELLGINLAEARRAAGGQFPLPVVRHLAITMLNALEQIHAGGFVHRDVKPANFAISPATADMASGTWKIIDFGLARRFVGDDGEVLPERSDTSFRGSTMYASIYAHQGADLGRRDDLWSWLYCVVELLDGALPWRADKEERENREIVRQAKLRCIQEPYTLTRNIMLPEPLRQVSDYINSLGFADTPDYTRIYGLLAQLPSWGTAPQAFPPGGFPGTTPVFQGTWLPSGMPNLFGMDAPANIPFPPFGDPSMFLAGAGCWNPLLGSGAHFQDQPNLQPPSKQQDVSPAFMNGMKQQPWKSQPQSSTGADNRGTYAEPGMSQQQARKPQHLEPDVGPPPPPPPSVNRVDAASLELKTMAISKLQQQVTHLQQGQASQEVQGVMRGLLAVDPVEAMTAIAAVFDLLASASDASSCHIAAAALQDMSVFAENAAQQALVRYQQHKSQLLQHTEQKAMHQQLPSPPSSSLPGKPNVQFASSTTEPTQQNAASGTQPMQDVVPSSLAPPASVCETWQGQDWPSELAPPVNNHLQFPALPHPPLPNAFSPYPPPPPGIPASSIGDDILPQPQALHSHQTTHQLQPSFPYGQQQQPISALDTSAFQQAVDMQVANQPP